MRICKCKWTHATLKKNLNFKKKALYGAHYALNYQALQRDTINYIPIHFEYLNYIVR